MSKAGGLKKPKKLEKLEKVDQKDFSHPSLEGNQLFILRFAPGAGPGRGQPHEGFVLAKSYRLAKAYSKLLCTLNSATWIGLRQAIIASSGGYLDFSQSDLRLANTPYSPWPFDPAEVEKPAAKPTELMLNQIAAMNMGDILLNVRNGSLSPDMAIRAENSRLEHDRRPRLLAELEKLKSQAAA